MVFDQGVIWSYLSAPTRVEFLFRVLFYNLLRIARFHLVQLVITSSTRYKNTTRIVTFQGTSLGHKQFFVAVVKTSLKYNTLKIQFMHLGSFFSQLFDFSTGKEKLFGEKTRNNLFHGSQYFFSIRTLWEREAPVAASKRSVGLQNLMSRKCYYFQA